MINGCTCNSSISSHHKIFSLIYINIWDCFFLIARVFCSGQIDSLIDMLGKTNQILFFFLLLLLLLHIYYERKTHNKISINQIKVHLYMCIWPSSMNTSMRPVRTEIHHISKLFIKKKDAYLHINLISYSWLEN